MLYACILFNDETSNTEQLNIIITGASRGIGFETTKILSQDADHHLVVISRNIEKLKVLKEECKSINPNTKVFPVEFDLESSDFEKQLLPKILKHISSVDILLNNAGVLINKPFQELSQKDFHKTFDVNFFSIIKLIQVLIPLMEKRSSSIVNISSMGGFQGSKKFSGLSAYSASKAALAILTECLAEELKEINIAVNCLALGAADTEMLQQAFPGYKAPLSAGQMARFIADFCINGHKYYNGKIIPVSLSL